MVYRSASQRDTPRVLVIHGRRSLEPLLALLFALPMLLMLSRTELHCSRSQDLCTYRTRGVVSGSGSVRLSDVSNLEGRRDGAAMRPSFVLRSGSTVPLSPVDDSLVMDEKRRLVSDFSTYLALREDSFDEGYGPSTGCLEVIGALVLAVGAFIAGSRQRAVLVIDPVADTTDVTFYPGLAGAPRRTRLEHARLRLAHDGKALFDESGHSVDLPRGTSRHAIETLRDVLGHDEA